MSRPKGATLNYSPEKVLEAIKGSYGIITTIAERLNCVWQTAKNYINKWPETKEAYEAEREAILDMAESTVYRNIKDGNSQDAKWVLSTLGKRRGFTERHEVTGADGKDLVPEKIKIEFINDAECKNT